MASPDLITDLDARRQAVASAWDDAVQAAGFSSEEVVYWISEETPSEIRDRAAMYFLPGPDPDPPHAFSEVQLQEATADEVAERHRIMVHVDYELPEGLDAGSIKAFFAASSGTSLSTPGRRKHQVGG